MHRSNRIPEADTTDSSMQERIPYQYKERQMLAAYAVFSESLTLIIIASATTGLVRSDVNAMAHLHTPQKIRRRTYMT